MHTSIGQVIRHGKRARRWECPKQSDAGCGIKLRPITRARFGRRPRSFFLR
jgi:hypothetical protein